MSSRSEPVSRKPGSTEISMGINLFYTSTAGTGGKLRARAEDFVVDEVSLYPAKIDPPAKGRYTVATVTALNWETNKLIKKLARQLRIRTNRVHFAGTKDKRALTTQLMTFDTTSEKFKDVNIPDVQISNIYTSNHHLKMGRLYGNKFNILLTGTNLNGNDLKETITKTGNQLEKLNGFPNFFGVQRFGAVRPITHNVGRFMLKRMFKEAVWEYIAKPLPDDKTGFTVRSNLEKTKDLEAALEEYPKELDFERAMIAYLIDNPEDYIGALRRFPQNLLSMFVHSFQSFLFNKILCERIESGLSITEPMIGDLVLAVDNKNLPIHTEWYSTNPENITKLTRLVSKQRAFISGLVFGADTDFAGGEMGEIEKKIVESEALVPADFTIPELLSNPSRGIRRELVAPIRDFEFETGDDWVRFKFGLLKGTYATSLLREYMKTEAKNY